MAVTFSELVVDAADPHALAAFWQRVLDWDYVDHGTEAELRPPSGGGPSLLFALVPEAKTVKNRLHVDLTPAPGSDQAAELARLLALGARPADVGQGEQTWIVLADPEGNEFCLLRGAAPA